MNELALFSNEQNQAICTFNPTTKEDKIKLYNIIMDPDHVLSECTNIPIKVKDIYAEPFAFTNDDGEYIETVKIILIDDEGETYSSISRCVYESLNKIIAVFGMPTWEEGLTLMHKQKTKQGKDGKPRNIQYLVVV